MTSGAATLRLHLAVERVKTREWKKMEHVRCNKDTLRTVVESLQVLMLVWVK